MERRLLFREVMIARAPLLATVALLTFQTSSALGSPGLLPPPAPPAENGDTAEPERTVWYGYKLMLADAASIGLLFAAGAADSGAIGVTGLASMFVAAPVIHAMEGRNGRAVGSLGLRVLMPLTGGILASWAYDRGRNGDDCDCMGGVIAGLGGMVLGMGAAMLVDGLVLGWRTEPRSAPKDLALIPTVGVAPGGASLGLAGRF